MKTTHGSRHKPSHGATSDIRQAPQEQKEKTRKKKTKNTNSGQNHKEKAPRKSAHILREKEKKRSAIYVGDPSCERLGGEFLGCWKCWKCWECWKIYDFSTLSMFSMLSMLQKGGERRSRIPLYCERSSHQTQRRGAHKFHKGETARQGRQHSAEKRTSSAGRQERQLRKAGTRAAGSQKLRLWRSLF